MPRIFSAIKRFFSAPEVMPAAAVAGVSTYQEPVAQSGTEPVQDLEPAQVMAMFYQFILGQPHSNQPLASADKKRLMQLSKGLRDEQQVGQYAPRLPLVVPQLLRSLRDVNSSAAQQAEIISQDPVIAASVLRVANSPRFKISKPPVDSFQRAIVTLGNNGVRAILSTVAMQPIMEIENKHYNAFGRHIWHNALSTAICAQLLAPQRGLDPFQAYMAGLIHNIGASTAFNQLMNHCVDDQAPSPGLVFQAATELGPSVSTKLARLWDFDADIVRALKELEQAGLDSGAGNSQLGKVLSTSRHLCQAYSLWQHDLINQEQVEALLLKYRQPSNRFEQLKLLLAE